MSLTELATVVFLCQSPTWWWLCWGPTQQSGKWLQNFNCKIVEL